MLYFLISFNFFFFVLKHQMPTENNFNWYKVIMSVADAVSFLNKRKLFSNLYFFFFICFINKDSSIEQIWFNSWLKNIFFISCFTVTFLAWLREQWEKMNKKKKWVSVLLSVNSNNFIEMTHFPCLRVASSKINTSILVIFSYVIINCSHKFKSTPNLVIET